MAQLMDQLGLPRSPDVSDSAKPQFLQPFRRNRPDSRDSPSRQRRDGVSLGTGSDEGDLIGMATLRLGHLRGNLGHELARPDTHRATQSLGALCYPGTQFNGNLLQSVEVLDVDVTGF